MMPNSTVGTMSPASPTTGFPPARTYRPPMAPPSFSLPDPMLETKRNPWWKSLTPKALWNAWQEKPLTKRSEIVVDTLGATAGGALTRGGGFFKRTLGILAGIGSGEILARTILKQDSY